MTRRPRAVAATLAVALTAPLTAVVATPVATAGPCSEMFGNFGSLLAHRTGAGMGTGSHGVTVDALLGSANGSGSLVRQLETGSLGNSLSGSLNRVTGSVYGMPQWVTGEEGTVPVLRGPTRFVQLVTGPTSPDDTVGRFGVRGTDLGIMWDNDDPVSPRVLIAFGDTMGDCTAPDDQWRSNVLLRSADRDLTDGLTIDSALTRPDGMATSIVPRSGLPGEVTIIPTAGIAVDGVQYLRFMSVARWGRPGSWETNYSGLAVSEDDGETWTVRPEMARPLTDAVPVGDGAPEVSDAWRRAQMSSYLRADGHVYEFLTPSGRQGSPLLARVPESDVLDPAAYEYRTATGWSPDISEARVVFGGPASEMSVMYNEYLGRYVAMYSSGLSAVVIRTAERPEGPWSTPTVLINYSVLPGVYGAFMHPWAQGEDLYYLVTTWDAYNVFLVRTRLSEIFVHGFSPARVGDPSELPPGTEVVRRVPVGELVDGRVPTR